MGNFNRDNRGGGGRPFGKKNFGGGDRGGFRGGDRRDGGRPSMHAATCSECGNACEVPFRPTGDRPIFCSTCFGKQKSQESKGFGGGSRERSFDRPRYENKRPDFRRPEPAGDNKAMEQFKQQLEIMNNKLERILKAVTPELREKSTEEEVAQAKTETKPKAKKAKTKKKK